MLGGGLFLGPTHPGAAAGRPVDRVRQLLPSRPHRPDCRGAARGPDRAAGRASPPASRCSWSAWACAAWSLPAGRSTTSMPDAFAAELLRRDARRARRSATRCAGRGRRSTGRAAEDTTWGAYQCYGEPDWRLVPRTAGFGGGGPRQIPLAGRGGGDGGADQGVGPGRPRTVIRPPCASELDELNLARRRKLRPRSPRAAGGTRRGLWRARLAAEGGTLLCGRNLRPQGAVALRAIEQHANLLPAWRHAACRRDPRRQTSPRASRRSSGRSRAWMG